MCGISAVFGPSWRRPQLESMVAAQTHRGPDAQGLYISQEQLAGLGHNRLSIIDLSDAGRQPMADTSGRYRIVFNGEIYNYLELRRELQGTHDFRTQTDTEVLLAAYAKWGVDCLRRLVGMFAFVIWDEQEKLAFGARDRFGVKPLHYARTTDGNLLMASEIKALHAAGLPRRPNQTMWATYLTYGMYDHADQTFWNGIERCPPGSYFTWSLERGLRISRWYDLYQNVVEAGPDLRSDAEVSSNLIALFEETIRLRFRADVPVGVCLSGGLDSSLLLALVRRVQGPDSCVKSFTFECGDATYDESPWVKSMLATGSNVGTFCRLDVGEVPELSRQIQALQDEPFGGLPTLGMAKIHQAAREVGVVVLLDGNGLDEGWAGYEYYQRAGQIQTATGPVQGSRDPSTRPDCLHPDFRACAEPFIAPTPFSDVLLDLQNRDLRHAKIPRAMRFADRVSMMYSRELREPFLDHRIAELGLRQPAARKIRSGQGKWLIRDLASRLLPESIREAPKRPVQTPQREWLRGPLRGWVRTKVRDAIEACPDWFDNRLTNVALDGFMDGFGDNSFYVWQWLSAGMIMSR